MSIIAYIPLIIVLGFFGLTVGIAGEDAAPILALPLVLLLAVIMIGIVIIAVMIPFAFSAAFYRICKAKDFNEVTSDDYFYYFKGKYFKKMAIIVAASIAIAIPAALLCYLPLLFVVVPISFFTIIFAFNPELSASDILSLGFKIGVKKWGITIALLLVSWLLSLTVGLMLCGIGLLFTSAFIYMPIYFIYKHVIGFEDDYRVYPSDIKRIN